MHTNAILTNKRCTHAQSNYTNTKLKTWFRRLLRHPASKWSGPILHSRTDLVSQPMPGAKWSSVTDLPAYGLNGLFSGGPQSFLCHNV